MKNKKALMIASTLVKIIIALVVLFLIVIPACNKVREYFFSYGTTESFETFVDGINSMEPGTKQFVLRLDEGSGVIGFGREAYGSYENDFKCYCGSKMSGLTSLERLNVIIDKPSNPECNDKACICLCELETLGETIDGGSGTHGNCKRIISCKGLNAIDITDKTMIDKKSNLPLLGGDWFQYWKKSFLFYRSIAGISEYLNGLGSNLNKEEVITLSVEKRGNLVGVCNSNMLKFNKERLGINGCINKDAASSCASHRSYRCDSGHVYWFNSCGTREDMQENCGTNGCTGDSCNLPSGCSCSGWSNGNCGAGGCSSTEMQQTRTCTPSGCSSASRCVSDSSCGGWDGSTPSTLCGLNIQSPWYGGNFDALTQDWQNLGVKMIRFPIIKEDAGNINYQKYNTLINSLAPNHGMSVLAILHYDSINYGRNVKNSLDISDTYDNSNNKINEFAGRAQEIAQHYGNRINYYQIWNEEDNVNPPINSDVPPRNFGKLLQKTYDTIKSVNPSAVIVMGGLVSGNTNYLNDVYNSQAVMNYKQTNGIYPFDAVAIHPYTLVSNIPNTIQSYRNIMASKGDNSPIWITEVGYQSAGPCDESCQANQINDLYNTVSDISYVSYMQYFNYQDFPSQPWYGGLVRQNGAHKSAYNRYNEICT